MTPFEPKTVEQQICDLYKILNQISANAFLKPENGKGEWNPDTQYNAGDVVSFGGNSYFAIKNNSGMSPGLPANVGTVWQILAVSGTPGKPGVGIAAFENDGTSVGDGFTITHVKTTLTDGTEESLDVYAENGMPPKVIALTLPESATYGTLTQAQLTDLQSDVNAMILLNNEYYRLADEQTAAGYLIYSHVGHDNSGAFFTKTITITLSALTYVITSVPIKKYYKHVLLFSGTDDTFGNVFIKIEVVNNSVTQFTKESLYNFLVSVKATSRSQMYPISGNLLQGGTTGFAFSVYATPNSPATPLIAGIFTLSTTQLQFINLNPLTMGYLLPPFEI